MAAPFMTIKIRAGHRLMERIQAAGRGLDLTPAQFVEHAIESELARQENSAQVEGRTLAALQQNVLDAGQAVSVHHEAETGEHATCQLCLKVIPDTPGVEGPLLCTECYNLAQGAPVPGVRR